MSRKKATRGRSPRTDNPLSNVEIIGLIYEQPSHNSVRVVQWLRTLDYDQFRLYQEVARSIRAVDSLFGISDRYHRYKHGNSCLR